MWLSSMRRARRPEGPMVGRATLAGNPAGAWLDGERRALPVFGPGGYVWKPALGQELLVLKSGPEEPACVAGTRCEAGELEPGEVTVRAGKGGAALKLKNDGTLELCGQIYVNGVPLEMLLKGG